MADHVGGIGIILTWGSVELFHTAPRRFYTILHVLFWDGFLYLFGCEFVSVYTECLARRLHFHWTKNGIIECIKLKMWNYEKVNVISRSTYDVG